MESDLLHRIRWANVARAAAVLVAVALVVAWPHLEGEPPALPPAAAEPVSAPPDARSSALGDNEFRPHGAPVRREAKHRHRDLGHRPTPHRHRSRRHGARRRAPKAAPVPVPAPPRRAIATPAPPATSEFLPSAP